MNPQSAYKNNNSTDKAAVLHHALYFVNKVMCGQNVSHFSVEGEICHLQLAGPTLPKNSKAVVSLTSLW